MKIFAFTDLHANKKSIDKIIKKIKEGKPELIICCGDLTIFGNDLNEISNKLNLIGIKILIIPGNHETEQEIKNICKKNKNLINLHKENYEYGNYIFFGFGTGGFSFIEPELEEIIRFKKCFDKTKKLIFITHAPIYHTKLDYLYKEHMGCKSSRKFIDKFKPILTLCGHFHENENKKDKIKNCLIINPGHQGTFIEI